MTLPKIVAIVGPTASGKTSLGIELAKQFNGEIVSVDSRMVFKEMTIGTAKPEGDVVSGEMVVGGGIHQLFGGRVGTSVEGIVHWGMDLVSPNEEYSAAQFKAFALDKIRDILSRGKRPILVGGTGMWLSAVINNLDLSSTPSDPVLRAELETRSIGDLYHEYKQRDPLGAETIDRDNKRRLVRALEVTLLTGVPFSARQTRGKPLYEVLQIGLRVEPEVLRARINDRVDEMIGRGLVNEVRALVAKYGKDIEAMTGIGYRQVVAFLEGECSLVAAIEEIKKDTRAYAKRQMTWFKRDERIHWIDRSSEAVVLIEDFLSST